MTHAHETNRVRKAREAKGLLLIELAENAGISASKLSGIERGYVPRLPTMLQIADALGVEADELWPDEFDPVEPS